MKSTALAAISGSIAPATLELCAILHDFCAVRHRLERFYDSDHGETMQEYGDNYTQANNALDDAMGTLFDFVGYYMHCDFIGAKSTQSQDHE